MTETGGLNVWSTLTGTAPRLGLRVGPRASGDGGCGVHGVRFLSVRFMGRLALRKRDAGF
jgi:hypothetical protein